MDNIQFLTSRQSQVSSIGTRDLAGCSVVMIASPRGAIVAHISPDPNRDPNDLQAGDHHVQQAMDRVAAFYDQTKTFFPPGTDTWVVRAVHQEVVASPDQKRTTKVNIARMGLTSFSSILYVVSNGDEYNASSGKGMVFIDGRAAKPIVYVEDRVVSQTQQASTSDWVWDREYNRYRQLVEGE
ncbi:hypothetical protein LTR66_014276 [Elasticomyces elasticus]|nr:hypothetical protein LTR66_014276 [Elasticomyces elasticus]